MGESYDVLTVGGGLAGSALAKSLAEKGLHVLVVEQMREFKDRVRGETMPPWGVSELRALGLYEGLSRACGHDHPWFDIFLGPLQLMHRPLASTTPHAAPGFNFYHPLMQETLLRAAAQAGAEVRRGATVREIRPGRRPVAMIEQEGVAEEIAARLVVCADGRSSAGRRSSPQFELRRDPPFLVATGVLLENMRIPEDTGTIYMNPDLGETAYTFPQGGGRVRAYLAYTVTAGFRLGGEEDLPRFIEESIRAGAPAEAFEGVHAAGPLASFDAADTWVEHPYGDGLVLIGDAAASNDPAWGQGLSLTLRDVRILRDRLLATDDWEAACQDYACEHRQYYRAIHEVTLALKDMFQRPGPEADAWRARALPLIAQDPARVPDHVFSGPDLPWNEEMRRVFFAEDGAAAQRA
ncbi:MAG TPA: NAD(P)/FAD-dependent oxidoreductase [Bryobacteraceae bacterium]|nr:NAD(P)/FAD-dependent oxidoreductase [Bryobacteraceae bacterium]